MSLAAVLRATVDLLNEVGATRTVAATIGAGAASAATSADPPAHVPFGVSAFRRGPTMPDGEVPDQPEGRHVTEALGGRPVAPLSDQERVERERVRNLIRGPASGVRHGGSSSVRVICGCSGGREALEATGLFDGVKAIDGLDGPLLMVQCGRQPEDCTAERRWWRHSGRSCPPTRLGDGLGNAALRR
jgi:hypothetical protein